jgi:hypothetical protein
VANLIDTSFFIGDIEIPNSNQPPITVDLEHSIALYEKEVLISLLGYPMYKDLQAAIAAVPVSGDKWYKLINGAEFTFEFDGETVTRYWEGLKGFSKRSLIAYYIYFMHRRKKASYMAGLGAEVESKNENSEPTSLPEKLQYIWNEFVEMYGDSCIEDEHENDAPSAYNYLLANVADFANWEFTSQGGEINRLGI